MGSEVAWKANDTEIDPTSGISYCKDLVIKIFFTAIFPLPLIQTNKF